jgi:hypothetical protein
LKSLTVQRLGIRISVLCYGVKDTEKYSVMGQGMELREKHAKAWREAITLITGKGNVVSSADWIAKSKRHYPRTIAEVSANKQIVVRPKR